MLPQLIAVFFILSNVGYIEADERIVNGVATTFTDISYQAIIQINGVYRCGGSIISTTYILTAAHCTDGYTRLNIQYIVGLTIIGPILKLFQHHYFNSNTLHYDIALLKINPIIQTDSIKIIPLAITTPVDGTSCIVSGYGATSFAGFYSGTLQKANVLIVNWTKCKNSYGGLRDLIGNMICALGFNNNKVSDACQGDDGGPLVCDGKLAGIVSFGYQCGNAAYPGIYTDVAKSISWIYNNMV